MTQKWEELMKIWSMRAFKSAVVVCIITVVVVVGGCAHHIYFQTKQAQNSVEVKKFPELSLFFQIIHFPSFIVPYYANK